MTLWLKKSNIVDELQKKLKKSEQDSSHSKHSPALFMFTYEFLTALNFRNICCSLSFCYSHCCFLSSITVFHNVRNFYFVKHCSTSIVQPCYKICMFIDLHWTIFILYHKISQYNSFTQAVTSMCDIISFMADSTKFTWIILHWRCQISGVAIWEQDSWNLIVTSDIKVLIHMKQKTSENFILRWGPLSTNTTERSCV